MADKSAAMTLTDQARQLYCAIFDFRPEDWDRISDEDKELCMQLLNPVNDFFTGRYQKQKNKSFEEMYEENVNMGVNRRGL